MRRDPTMVVDLDNENAVSAAERNLQRLQRQRAQIAAAESALAPRQNGARPRKREREVELDLPGRVTVLEAYVREHRADVRLRTEALDDRLAGIEADIDVLMDRLLTAPSKPTSTPASSPIGEVPSNETQPPRRSWWRWLLRRPPQGGQQMTVDQYKREVKLDWGARGGARVTWLDGYGSETVEFATLQEALDHVAEQAVERQA